MTSNISRSALSKQLLSGGVSIGQQMDVSDLKSWYLAYKTVQVSHSVNFSLCDNTHNIGIGDIFVCIKGATFDGHNYIGRAIENGAGAIVIGADCSPEQKSLVISSGINIYVASDTKLALAHLAQWHYFEEKASLNLLGVTGTNGKTTVAYMVAAMMNHAQRRCGLISTVMVDDGEDQYDATHTTPGAVPLAKILSNMVCNGLDTAVMECSSHGLDQERTAGVSFKGAAFTNLSGDHLDYHGDEKTYINAKGKLFKSLHQDAFAIINSEDPVGAMFAQRTNASVVRYGFTNDCDIYCELQSMTIDGSRFVLSMFGERLLCDTDVVGKYNISNVMAAAGLAWCGGLSITQVALGIKKYKGVPGRLEKIDTNLDCTVLIDYAHTDDALNHLLGTLKPLTKNRLILVFGCGGDRDKSKRARMGAVAQVGADIVFVTSDNPRTESPAVIIDDIVTGMKNTSRETLIRQIDRREAITMALELAQKDDVIVIAGKGHETSQDICGVKHDFDDRKVVLECATRMSASHDTTYNQRHQHKVSG